MEKFFLISLIFLDTMLQRENMFSRGRLLVMNSNRNFQTKFQKAEYVSI